MTELETRIAKVEQRVDGTDVDLADLSAKLDRVLEYQMRQRGFIAGIVFTVGAVASALTAIVSGRFHWGG